MPATTRRLLPLIGVIAALLLVPGAASADTSASRPMWPSIVVDNDNKVHVAYDNADGNGIIYATNRSGSWVRRKLTNGNDSLPHLTVDAQDRVRIIFTRTFTDSPRAIYYVTNRTGEWKTKMLPWKAPGSTIRTAVSPSGTIHVVFTTDAHAYYVTNASGTWVRERLDAYFGNQAVLAVDVNGKVHIAYGQCLNDAEEEATCEGEGIWYRTNATGSWTTERITDLQLDRATSIVTDGAGKAHVIVERRGMYQGREEMGIGMYYLTNESGAWVRQTVAKWGRKGVLGVDRTGAVHVVYNQESETKRGIYYATNKSGVWVRSTAVAEHAIYPEMGLDSRGVVRLAFMRMAIDPGVYYAHNARGSWSRLELMD